MDNIRRIYIHPEKLAWAERVGQVSLGLHHSEVN